MNILHTSPKGLPDWRIERQSYLSKKKGHHVEFLGLGKRNVPFLDVFDNATMLRSINNRQAALDKKIREEWAQAVTDISPDLIDANDIIAAEFELIAKKSLSSDLRSNLFGLMTAKNINV